MTDADKLRDHAADHEAAARAAFDGYPKHMQPYLDEAAKLRRIAARLEALERVAAEARAHYHQHGHGGIRLDEAIKALTTLDDSETSRARDLAGGGE